MSEGFSLALKKQLSARLRCLLCSTLPSTYKEVIRNTGLSTHLLTLAVLLSPPLHLFLSLSFFDRAWGRRDS